MRSNRYDYDNEAEFAAWEARAELEDEARAQAEEEYLEHLSPYVENIADECDSYDEARGVAALILEDDEFAMADRILRGIFGEDEA